MGSLAVGPDNNSSGYESENELNIQSQCYIVKLEKLVEGFSSSTLFEAGLCCNEITEKK